MLTRWTEHLQDEESKQRFKNEVLGARSVLERLDQMLDEDERALGRAELDQRIYDKPNWEYRQAHKNGVRQYINAMKTTINLDHKEKTNDRKSVTGSNRRPTAN